MIGPPQNWKDGILSRKTHLAHNTIHLFESFAFGVQAIDVEYVFEEEHWKMCRKTNQKINDAVGALQQVKKPRRRKIQFLSLKLYNQPGPGPGPEQNREGHGCFLLFSRWSIPNSLTQSPILVFHVHRRSLPQLTPITLPS